jgi:hypothetical protein
LITALPQRLAELIAVTWLPRFAASGRERYLAVTLQFDVTMNPAMLEGLRSDSLDLALMIHTGTAMDLLTRPLARFPSPGWRRRISRCRSAW